MHKILQKAHIFAEGAHIFAEGGEANFVLVLHEHYNRENSLFALRGAGI